LLEYTKNITICDPHVDIQKAKDEYNVDITKTIPEQKYDTVILAVAHDEFKKINNILSTSSIVYDVKGFFLEYEFDGRL
ncbi:MAG: nucleotide sugar dehydrogenase, partial [Tannerella sp.]|jgi:UDP-N-acetyl-D-galactosamine dehydrogenase|nr:nucleotide sugar dehydrogenase [Tannerella sp.]